MEKEIINKVANSVLEVFDLEDYFPKQPIHSIDVSQWLVEGFILKEKEFRESLKNHDWLYYKDSLVSIYCATDAILPAWTFALVSVYLQPYASKVVSGNKNDLLLNLYQEKLNQIDFSIYDKKPVILKGCSNKPVPQEAYVLAIQKIMPYAKSVMFGEACSAVPLFKSNK
ncbi:DUF2480 family protein [uncultured Flavobacterium sp.]|uniref:DUF2480 family protein n=1 Tax=uncultured Flavobacterium sp. TaxID=165435 RepID=UPI0030EB4143|tara:strand:+ start:4555 stop:5064 length:510 start_codon:yes stop_codon:yes gene_type:complete